ncbi:MAG: hypothetical protein MHMPM18_001228 [Marteilia pararefringens]
MVRSTEHYDTLGVSPDATQAQISKAFRRLVATKHPDKNKNTTHEEFEAINKAYHVLKNPETRAQYDRGGMDFASNMGGFDMSGADDMFGFFDSFLGGSHRSGSRQRKPEKADFNIELELFANLEDVFHGTEKTIIFSRRDFCTACDSTGAKSKKTSTCSRCNGKKKTREVRRLSAVMIQEVVVDCPACKAKGFVIEEGDKCNSCKGSTFVKQKQSIKKKIEIGDVENRKYYFKDMGHNSLFDKNIYGDLILHLKIKPHKSYLRFNNDLYLHARISYIEALFGFTRQIKHISGDLITIKHNAEDKPIVTKSVRTLWDYGMPVLGRSNKFGALYLVFEVVYPTESACLALSKEERVEIANRLTQIPESDLISKSSRAAIQMCPSVDQTKSNGTDKSKTVLPLSDGDMLSSANHKYANEAYGRAEAQSSDRKFLGPAHFYYAIYKTSSKNPNKALNIDDISFTDSDKEEESTNDEENVQRHFDTAEDMIDAQTRDSAHSGFSGHSEEGSHHAQNVQCQSH